jgi:hypothetical protein
VFLLHLLVELPGGAGGNGQAFPGCVPDHFADINDLADVMGVVCQLPVYGIDGHQGFVADRYRLQQVFFFEGPEGIEEAVPAFFPAIEQGCFSARRRAEFLVAVAARFFSVFGEEICPAAHHITMQVMDDDGDAVAMLVGCKIKVFFIQLGEGAVAEGLIGEKTFDGRFEIDLAEGGIHD